MFSKQNQQGFGQMQRTSEAEKFSEKELATYWPPGSEN